MALNRSATSSMFDGLMDLQKEDLVKEAPKSKKNKPVSSNTIDQKKDEKLPVKEEQSSENIKAKEKPEESAKPENLINIFEKEKKSIRKELLLKPFHANWLTKIAKENNVSVNRIVEALIDDAIDKYGK